MENQWDPDPTTRKVDESIKQQFYDAAGNAVGAPVAVLSTAATASSRVSASDFVVALETLVDSIRWRARCIGCDGEDLEPDEIQAFDRAEALLAQCRASVTLPKMSEGQTKWKIQETDIETPPDHSHDTFEIGYEHDGFTYLGSGWWRKGNIISKYESDVLSVLDLSSLRTF